MPVTVHTVARNRFRFAEESWRTVVQDLKKERSRLLIACDRPLFEGTPFDIGVIDRIDIVIDRLQELFETNPLHSSRLRD